MIDWKPPAPIAQEAARLRKALGNSQSSYEARAILSLLETDRRMSRVWTELYRSKLDNYRKTGKFLHPARVTN